LKSAGAAEFLVRVFKMVGDGKAVEMGLDFIAGFFGEGGWTGGEFEGVVLILGVVFG